MTNKLSFKSLTDADTLIFVAPILVVVSTFHIFDSNDFTHKFGQIEIMASILICCYYLWEKIALVYSAEFISKKRIEAVVCIVIGIFTALLLIPPLLSWQYFNLYRASDRTTLSKPILIAVASLWIGCAVLFTSSFMIAKAQVEAAKSLGQESSMPEATPTK
jgi:hypothetical protein